MASTFRNQRIVTWGTLAVLISFLLPNMPTFAQEAKPADESPQPAETGKEEATPDKPKEPAKPAIRKLMPNMPVWIDTKRKMVIMDGEICLRKGSLEMFACLRQTKEHESVVAVATDAYVVHAALLAIGAEQGRPVEFDPEYQPPSGQKIDVLVQWKDENGKLQTRRAQDWVRDARSKKVMNYDWVFPGSYFWKDVSIEAVQKAKEEGVDPDTLPGKMVYAAEGGELICVSNFKSSMMDLPVPSTDANNDLWFEAFTENIPTEGTKVRLFLIPRKSEEKKPAEEGAETKQEKKDVTAELTEPMLELPEFSPSAED
ncbi:YdjY domain-containing protein [Bremerella sp. JC770]|uniref:YdjY domain-containing protein n=1 Tax=Bremerella sp. JC770 TaxID=3232137 RepID=UPI00345A54F1